MRKLTHIEVVNRVKILLPTLTIISEYDGRFKKIIVKDELNILYNVSPDKLLYGKKPSLATAINKNDGFEKQARNVHGNKYDYSNTQYSKNNNKVNIICKEHGVFNQLATNHLSGQGCPLCGENAKKINRAENGFSKTQWINHCNMRNKIPILYIIRCFNNEELFFKIGITTHSIEKRFYANRLPYKYEIIRIVNGSPEEIYTMEKNIKIEMKEHRYLPKKKFCGYTECYSNGKGVIA